MMNVIKKIFSKTNVDVTAEIASKKIPRHVAIIMDGNGRWAKSQGKPRIEGHRMGAKRVREITEAALRSGVEFLTLYAFSSENWNRPKSEVDALMALLVLSVKSYGADLKRNKIRFRMIGNIDALPENCVKALRKLEKETENFEGLNLVLALNYGARDELVRAVGKMTKSAIQGTLNPDKISWEDIAQNLDTKDIPDPDFLIRTSGEMRLSNYLLLQSAYAELYFTNVFWPDFDSAQFAKALADYAGRERRYGLTGEQIKK